MGNGVTVPEAAESGSGTGQPAFPRIGQAACTAAGQMTISQRFSAAVYNHGFADRVDPAAPVRPCHGSAQVADAALMFSKADSYGTGTRW